MQNPNILRDNEPATLSIRWMREAFRYALSARVIIMSQDFQKDSSAYLTPSVYLTGHALELALKACLIRAAKPIRDVEAFGHRLTKLWKCPECEIFIQDLFNAAHHFQHIFSETGAIETQSALTMEEFTGKIALLNCAYGKGSSYALKYPSPANNQLSVPRAGQLALPLERATREYVMKWEGEA